MSKDPTNPYSMVTHSLAQFKSEKAKLTVVLAVCTTGLVVGIAALLYYGPMLSRVDKVVLDINHLSTRVDRIENVLRDRGILTHTNKEIGNVVYDSYF